MSYYENRIKELERRIEQMARANRLKAIPVEAQLIDRIAELKKENARLKAEVERLYRNGDLMLKFAAANMTYPAYATMAKDWNAAKEGKPSV